MKSSPLDAGRYATLLCLYNFCGEPRTAALLGCGRARVVRALAGLGTRAEFSARLDVVSDRLGAQPKGPSVNGATGAPLAEHLRDEIRKVIGEIGEKSAAKKFGCNPTTLLRAISPLGVSSTTRSKIEAALAA